jgi:hypothetical protein
MDKSKLFVILVGSIIIILFSFYSFGGYLSSNSTSKAGTKVQPVNSFSNSPNTHLTNNANTKPLQFITYTNRETAGNYYSLKLPNYVNVLHGNKPGSYITKLPNGILSVELMDIPDTSNPELLFLTNVKPSLESSLKNYHQISLRQLTIDGKRAWDLTYVWKNSTKDIESSKTLMEGPDAASVITYSGEKPNFIDNQSINSTLITPILNSFHWIA